MGMVIRTNAPANNAIRQNKKNNKSAALSFEKLATGFKINRAADDASGLAISEGMRAQILQLDTYSDNAENGISLIQTAEGAMSEIADMLHRCVELSVKAANGIYTDNERKIIQEEINQLTTEIDRVSDTAHFNNIMLLSGPKVEVLSTQPIIIGGLPPWATLSGNGSLSDKYINGSNTYSAAYLDCSAFTGSTADIQDAVGKGLYTTCCTCDNHYSIEFTNSDKNTMQRSGRHYIYKIGIADCKTADDVYDAILSGTGGGNPNGHYTQMKKEGGKLVIYDERPGQQPYPSLSMGLIDKGVAYDPDDLVKSTGGGMAINVGYNKVGKIYIGLPQISSATLGVGGAGVLDQNSASKSIDMFRDAIDTISIHRGILGALQNRAEHTINNLNVTSENMSASKSRLKDTDMAKEMSEYTKNNILMQASQAMIAQANTQAQSVLQILQ